VLGIINSILRKLTLENREPQPSWSIVHVG